MHDKPQDQKASARPDGTKSYDVNGDTAEFDAGAYQIHEISLDLQREMLGIKLPSLDPKVLEDTIPPNCNAAPPPKPQPARTRGPIDATAVTAASATARPERPIARSRAPSRGAQRRAGALALLGAAVIILCVLGFVIGRPRAEGEPGQSAAAATPGVKELAERPPASLPAPMAAPELERQTQRTLADQSAAPPSSAASSSLAPTPVMRPSRQRTAFSAPARAFDGTLAPAPRALATSSLPLIPEIKPAPVNETKPLQEHTPVPQTVPSAVPTAASSSKPAFKFHFPPR